MCLRVVRAWVHVEWMMFASSTSCRMRRDLWTGSDGCSTERDGGTTKSGGDSGGGGSSEGNSSLNGAPEAKLEAVVSGEIPENPHIAINSSRGSVVGILKLEGIGVFKLPPGKPKTAGSIVGSNVESWIGGSSDCVVVKGLLDSGCTGCTECNCSKNLREVLGVKELSDPGWASCTA
ncbi:hypothetical protein B0H10DRAFT_1939397 [Mycena sp. CBHHK59/15]|nr:hypothetical protein B0H10DRAFT_1939397 [Mycena sp. CBHHK59/15]